MKVDSQSEINNCLKILKDGGTILYPTDTIWGIGCDATNEDAVNKIYKIKQRDASKSMIILINEAAHLNKYVRNVPSVAWDIIELSDKPITIIYSGAANLAKNIIADDGSIGIRVVNDEFCKLLINKFGRAIVSTSANISEQPAPASFDKIAPAILSGVDYIVNLRREETSKHQASSIIKLEANGSV